MGGGQRLDVLADAVAHRRRASRSRVDVDQHVLAGRHRVLIAGTATNLGGATPTRWGIDRLTSTGAVDFKSTPTQCGNSSTFGPSGLVPQGTGILVAGYFAVEARTAAIRANDERDRANDERDRAEHLLYFSQLGRAQSDLQAGDQEAAWTRQLRQHVRSLRLPSPEALRHVSLPAELGQVRALPGYLDDLFREARDRQREGLAMLELETPA